VGVKVDEGGRYPEDLTISSSGIVKVIAASGHDNIKVDGNGTDAYAVDINAPNERKVSVNFFDRFDVGSEGLVLNNSATGTNLKFLTIGDSSRLRANVNYKYRVDGADVILAQVTSSSRSLLEGMLEVAGDRASLILANPGGITCNGCGFVNVRGVNLVGGKAIFDSENLSRRQVSGYLVSGEV
jgi:filamentous hemagglutinin